MQIIYKAIKKKSNLVGDTENINWIKYWLFNFIISKIRVLLKLDFIDSSSAILCKNPVDVSTLTLDGIKVLSWGGIIVCCSVFLTCSW